MTFCNEIYKNESESFKRCVILNEILKYTTSNPLKDFFFEFAYA